MKFIFILSVILIVLNSKDQNPGFNVVRCDDYLMDLKTELQKQWPENRTINIVFHGHSVPAGYFGTPEVNTLGAYPYLVLKKLKTIYPFAVVNVIVTANGGENYVKGSKRFENEVLITKCLSFFILIKRN